MSVAWEMTIIYSLIVLFPFQFLALIKLAEGIWAYQRGHIRPASIWHGKRLGDCNIKEEKKQHAQVLSGIYSDILFYFFPYSYYIYMTCADKFVDTVTGRDRWTI